VVENRIWEGTFLQLLGSRFRKAAMGIRKEEKRKGPPVQTGRSRGDAQYLEDRIWNGGAIRKEVNPLAAPNAMNLSMKRQPDLGNGVHRGKGECRATPGRTD